MEYDAAIASASWASRKDPERSYRLPTEEEWEYACRAGAKTLYSFGDDSAKLPKYANVADADFARLLGLHGRAIDLRDGFAATAPVGSFRPNSWGLHDMHGNACEWCSTRFTFPQDLSVHTGPEPRDERIYKGGAYSSLPGCSACH